MSGERWPEWWRWTVASWVLYAAFVVVALWTGWHDDLLDFSGTFGIVKAAVWLAWVGFLAFSVWVSFREGFVGSVMAIWKRLWGRQIGTDLYLGLGLSLVLILLHGGPWVLLAWIVPIVLFANLAALLYVGIHFDSIVSAFGA